MPSYLEMVMTWRYAPYKMENRKYPEGWFPKVDFQRGETMDDQTTDTGYGGMIGMVGGAFAAVAAAVGLDLASGGRFGIGKRVGGLLGKAAEDL